MIDNTYLDGEKLVKPFFPMCTSLTWGGEVTINAEDNTKFDIAEGAGYIVDSYTNPAHPIIKKITWNDLIGISVTNISTQIVTFLAIDEDGIILQSSTPIIQNVMREYISLGILTHVNLTTINKAENFVVWNQDSQLYNFDLSLALGSLINFSGNVFSANGSNLKINKNAGVIFGWGTNYKYDKKNPNYLTTSAETAPYFILTQRGTPTIATSTDNIPVTQYDPNGDEILVDIPDGFFVTHRIYYDANTESVVVQYGQFLYDSMKKAAQSFDKEDFIEIPEILGAAHRCVIIVKQGATDLSDITQARFVNMGIFGDLTLNRIPYFSRFGETVEVIDGLSYQRQDITLLDDSGTIYADIEKIGGGDITYVFGQLEYILDCTTGSGVDGKARIALTAGTATVPQKNWIYVTKSGDDAILNSNTAEPTGEYAMIGTVLLPDITTFQNSDAYGSRRWSDSKDVDNRGVIANILRKLRSFQADYKSGLLPTLIISTVPDPDEMDVTITSGIIREIYNQTTDSLQLSIDGGLVVNDQTTAYNEITDLNEISTDAEGNSLFVNNTYYQIIIAISTNTDGKTRLLINKPSGSYNNASDAFNDVNNYSSTNFPNDFETISLVCAFVIRYQSTSGGTFTNAATDFGVDFIDLRGANLGTTASGSGAAAIQQFSDANFKIFDDLDNTKEIAFEASNITTATTRTLSVQDKDGTIALADSDGNLQLTDGVSTPNTIAGTATIYVDSADGDLKIKFGDGTIKTISTDT